MKRLKLHSVATEKISSLVLYALVAIVAVVFVLFYLVGFQMPYLPEPSFNAPMFTDAVIYLMDFLLFLAVVTAALAIVKTVRKTGKGEAVSNGIPVRKISFAVIGVLVVLLAGTFALGSVKPIMVNGVDFADRLWLRVADMFINTSLVLLVLAIAAVVFGASRYYRKGHK